MIKLNLIKKIQLGFKSLQKNNSPSALKKRAKSQDDHRMKDYLDYLHNFKNTMI